MSKESLYKRHKPGVASESTNNDYAWWFVFSMNKLLVTGESGIPYLMSLTELNISALRTGYLGTLQGHPVYSAEVSPDITVPQGMSFNELRSLYSVLDEDIYLLAGKAIQILNWDQTTQFCGRCGHKTELVNGERAKKCPACGFTSYPRISPATITAILKDNKILLSHNASFRGNMHSLIAGFVEPGETLEECIHREVLEEVGIEVKNIKYFGSQPWPYPNSLMIGFTAEWESGEISVDGKEISEAGWYDAHNLPELPARMSIAREIIDWFVENHPPK